MNFTKNDIYKILNETDSSKRNTKLSIQENSILLSFFVNQFTEIIINIIDFVLMMALLIDFNDTLPNYLFILIPQVVWFLFFLF